MKEGYLRLDRVERVKIVRHGTRNKTRAWFRNAWRIVGKDGEDLVQPWPLTKTEARETAKALSITIVGIYKEGKRK